MTNAVAVRRDDAAELAPRSVPLERVMHFEDPSCRSSGFGTRLGAMLPHRRRGVCGSATFGEPN